MGPLRKASAVMALASITREGSIWGFMAVPLLRSTIARKSQRLIEFGNKLVSIFSGQILECP